MLKWFIIMRSPQKINRKNNHVDHFLMVYSDDPLTLNPCCCIFILKIDVKGWARLVVLPWFRATCPVVFTTLETNYLHPMHMLKQFHKIKMEHKNIFLLVSWKMHELYQSFKRCCNKSKIVLDDEFAQNHATNNNAQCP